MNDFKRWPETDVDVLVGGTPCQSFSVAGLRAGLADPRGNLALVYLAIARRRRVRWLVWENVPGVLSSDDGRDFGAIVGAMVKLGYGVAWTVLDAQYFGVPQRRRRVFVVGHLGDWRRAAEVLFEPESLRRDPPPSRETGERVAGTATSSAARRRGCGQEPGLLVQDIVGQAMSAKWSKGTSGPAGDEHHNLLPVAHALRGEGFDASENDTGRGRPLTIDVAAPLTAGSNRPGVSAPGRRQEDDENLIAYNITPSNSNEDYNAREAEYAQALTAGGNRPSARGGDLVAFAQNQRDEVRLMDKAGALAAEPGAKQQTYVMQERAESENPNAGPDGAGFREGIAYTLEARAKQQSVAAGMAVRRLTPLECERLQGFPDGYTDIPGASDSARYKALGNSMAVPVMRWIGERIAERDC